MAGTAANRSGHWRPQTSEIMFYTTWCFAGGKNGLPTHVASLMVTLITEREKREKISHGVPFYGLVVTLVTHGCRTHLQTLCSRTVTFSQLSKSLYKQYSLVFWLVHIKNELFLAILKPKLKINYCADKPPNLTGKNLFNVHLLTLKVTHFKLQILLKSS